MDIRGIIFVMLNAPLMIQIVNVVVDGIINDNDFGRDSSDDRSCSEWVPGHRFFWAS